MKKALPRTARILVIDDDAGLRALLRATLGRDYEVEQAGDGRAGIAAAAREQPDLILLDIKMPGMSGYETCMLLKGEAATAAIPVIFLSALSNLDDRLTAYEAGGEDFLPKPFEPEELLDKVEAALRGVAERDDLQAAARSASSMAMTALSTAGEIGVVLDFLRRSFGCASLDELADAVIETVAAYGLSAVVQLRGTAAVLTRNRAGPSHALEAAVMTTLSGCGRISVLKNRLAVAYERATVMVTDMPDDDPDRSGRLRDHLAMLVEAADARVKSLNDAAKVAAQRQELARVLDRVRAALGDIDRRHGRHRAQTLETLHGMLAKTETAICNLGLSEAQEATVSESLRNAVFKVVDLFGEGLGVDDHLRAITDEVAAETVAAHDDSGRPPG